METQRSFTLSFATCLKFCLHFCTQTEENMTKLSRELRDRKRMRGSNREMMWEVILSKSTLAEKRFQSKKNEGIEKLI